MPHFRTALIATTLVAGLAHSASAALITYSGEDVVATTTSPHPVSAAAAANFDAAVTALGGGSLVNFENTPVGDFSSLTIAPGVVLTGSNGNGGNQSIRNTSNSPSIPTLDGYNTTPGGVGFVEMLGGTLTFSFAAPVQAFGAYFSGVQAPFFADTVTFSDGTSQTLQIPETNTSISAGGLAFVGFTDVGKSIFSVTISAGIANDSASGQDFIGVDDVRYQTVPASPPTGPTSTPEPASLVLVLTGLCGVAVRRHSRLTGRYAA